MWIVSSRHLVSWVHLAASITQFCRSSIFCDPPDVDAAPDENWSMCYVSNCLLAVSADRIAVLRQHLDKRGPSSRKEMTRPSERANCTASFKVLRYPRRPRIRQAHTPYAIRHTPYASRIFNFRTRNPFGPILPPSTAFSAPAWRGRPRGITPRPYSRRSVGHGATPSTITKREIEAFFRASRAAR